MAMTIKDFRKMLHGSNPNAEIAFRFEEENVNLKPVGVVHKNKVNPDKSTQKVIEITLWKTTKD